jgi:hypothetical protein
MGGTEAPAAGPSLAGRFAAAIALTVGFYLLALALAAGLLAAAILPWVLSGHGNLWVTLTGLVLGVTIVVAIVPRRRRSRRRAPSSRPTISRGWSSSSPRRAARWTWRRPTRSTPPSRSTPP